MSDTGAVKTPSLDLVRLSTRQKLALIGKLWDSIDGTKESPLTKTQLRDLEQRIAEYHETKDPGIPWTVVRDRILRRR